jgi:hypothetical protein
MNTPHRWSGWPGAWCLDCGIGDPAEHCLANHDHGADENGMPIVAPECYAGSCPEPNSRKHDPYTKTELQNILGEYQEAVGKALGESKILDKIEELLDPYTKRSS